MNRILLLAAGAGIIATVGAASGGAQTSGERTLVLFQDVGNESSDLIDNAPRSPSPDPESRRFRLSTGDEVVNRTPLLARRGGARIGTSHAHAVVVGGKTFEGAALQAQIVLALRGGTIALTGIAGARQKPFAITGGTGDYEGAQGSATETETRGGARLTLRLLP